MQPPRSVPGLRQRCGVVLFVLFQFRFSLLKIVLVKVFFFGRNGLGHLVFGALFQPGEELLRRDAALAGGEVRCRVAIRQVGTKG